MVALVGFTPREEELVTGMVARFRQDDYRLCELSRVEKADMPGYNGKVEPVRVGDGLDMTMYLSCLSPFTIAHELAHVSDISVRRQDTFDNLSLEMPTQWHLAHRMSSEYYANRVACEYAAEPHVLEAYKGDSAGFRLGVARQDWASVLIDYSLLLGIVHGMGRLDCDPLKLLPDLHLPDMVRRGIDNFRAQAAHFFDNYAAPAALAA